MTVPDHHDVEGRLTQITYPSTATNTFTYNALDTRVGKVDSAGTATYKRDGVDVTDPVLSDGAAGFTPGISERRSSATKYLHEDFLGSTTRLTDASQATTDTRQYDAFGNVVSTSGSNPLPFAFAGGWGYQTDSDSGLQLLGHRYFDPSTGRFLTRDPARDGRNWYGYCENNPSTSVDPNGLRPHTSLLKQLTGGAAHAGGGYGVGILGAPGGVDKYGMLKLGWPRPTSAKPYWVKNRTFHIDMPHEGFPFPHWNANSGPLKGLDHVQVPEWAVNLGKSSFLKGAGRICIAFAIAADAYAIYSAPPGHKGEPIGGAAGGWGGAIAGGAIGTAICPGFGTVVGGVVGGVVGYFGGSAIGRWIDGG